VVLWALATVTFLMLQLLPGDVAQTLLGFRYTEAAGERLRAELGLDRPIVVQYAHFWWHLLQGDLGRSMSTNVPVVDAVLEQVPATLLLAVSGLLIALTIGVTAGVFAAVRSPSWLDTTIMVAATLGLSVPNFLLALLLILLFAMVLGWVPVVGATGFAGLVMPALAVGLPAAGYIARVVRASMLDVLHAEYLTTARQKGVPERVVVTRHALRNALIPIITVIGLLFGQMLGGTVIVESVFARPGLGRLMVTAIQQRDIPQVQGTILFFGAAYVLVVVVTDLAYAAADPRIRAGMVHP